jgi:hypothetical protein
MSAVRTGPSSRMIATDTTAPTAEPGESAGDDDDRLRAQPDLDDLVHENSPANFLRCYGSESLAREHDHFTHVGEEPDDARADRGNERSHVARNVRQDLQD